MTSTQKNIFFSIVIPAYNRAGVIANTINSALTQKYDNYEIIVVDDGSTDRTEQIIQSIKSDKIRYFKIKNSERGAARNYGIKQSKGDYITCFDSDDVLYDCYLSNAYELINKYHGPPFFHLGYEIKNEKHKTITKINFLKNDDILFLAKGNPLGCQGVFVRNDVFNNMMFNEDRYLAGSEDWELWLRIASTYGFKCDNRISACLMNHKDRSVLNFSKKNLIRRNELSLKYAFENKMVMQKFGPYKQKMESFCDSYLSLHLILSGHKYDGFIFFIRSLTGHPFSIFTKRTLAIIKHLFL